MADSAAEAIAGLVTREAAAGMRSTLDHRAGDLIDDATTVPVEWLAAGAKRILSAGDVGSATGR